MKHAAPKRKITVAFIRWHDAAFQAGEQSIHEMQDYVELDSAGLLVREDDRTVSLALDYYPEDDSYRRILHIPKQMIRSIKRFKVTL